MSILVTRLCSKEVIGTLGVEAVNFFELPEHQDANETHEVKIAFISL